jgi:hypothetical protein
MPNLQVMKLVAGCLSIFASAGALAQARIVPAEPIQFERVHLRQTVDSCVFAEDNVVVSHEGDSIVVTQYPNACFAPGPPEVVDIQLGAFPPGDYRVEVRLGVGQAPIQRIAFTVHSIPRLAVVPPPPFPLADYSGIWWNPAESGWGLSLHQSPTETLTGALFLFDAEREPRWYTLQNGRWETSTRWTGQVFGSRGPAWFASWNPVIVSHDAVGTATLDFGMAPGQEDRAGFNVRIDGVRVIKTLSRLRF